MLCNMSQNAMGQTPGGVPCQVQPGQYPAWGYPVVGYPAWGYPVGGYPARGYPAGGYPAREDPAGGSLGRVPLSPARSGWGGYPARGSTLPGGGILLGGTQVGYPPARSGWGGTLPGGVAS